MRWASVVLCIGVLVVSECFGYYYPPVFWHWQNCVFRKLRESYGTNETKEYFIKVLPQNKLRIVCPSDITINDWIGQHARLKYQNLWLVDKNGYDSCRVNDDTNPSMNKLMINCNTPTKVKYKTFEFHPRFNLKEPRFVPGRHYYFIATGSGTKQTLQEKSGGHCTNYHMKLHIYVCDPKKETCIWEQPYCEPTYEFKRVMTAYSRSLPPPTRGLATLPPPSSQPPSLSPPSSSPTTRTVTEQKKMFETFNKHSRTPNPTKAITIETNNIYKYNKEMKDEETKDEQFKDEKFKESKDEEQSCQAEADGASVHMILNFVLGGVILFMAIVIVILSCGLARKSEQARPASGAFSVQEPNGNLYQESARFVQPAYTPASKSPPQTPISANPPFYLAPMAEIRPRSSSNRNAFNNTLYGIRQDSIDVQAGHEAASTISDNYANAPEPV